MFFKRIIATICLSACLLAGLANTVPLKASADISMKDRTMYDYEFFGKWDGEEQTYAPKLDYDNFPALAKVEAAAKEGDYEKAKSELLTYYRNMPPRRERTDELPNIPTIKEVEMELFFEGILTYGNSPVANATFKNTDEWVTYDVTDIVTNNLSNNNSTFSFSILARNKEEALISINSKELGENAAALNVISNGVQYSFPVTADLTIKGGSLSSENFGFEEKLYVRDSGWPADDDAARAFFLFETEGLNYQSRITSAQLLVYGSTDATSGSQETMLFKSEQGTWEEGEKTWENSGLYTFSWQNNFYEKFNWERPVGNYPDWSICVHRYYFLGGLSAYYRDTGNEKYAEAAIKFLKEYLSTNGAGQLLMPEDKRDAGLLIAVGMRKQAFPEILYRLLYSPSMTADVFCEIMKYVYDEMEFLYQTDVFEDTWTKDTNFGVEEVTGQLTTIDAFREFSDTKKWMDRISERVDYQLAMSDTPLILDDGSYIEATNSYSATVYKKYLTFKEMFNNLNYPLTEAYERQIRRMAYFFTSISEPNGYFTPYGDCPYMDQSETLEMIADEVGYVYNDDYLMYLGNNREKGKAPTYTSAAYPSGQVFVQRTGWEEDDLFLFTNTRINAVHGHNDDLHINLYAYGRQLLTDNPVYNYDTNSANTWMRYRKQGHSTIEIDGASGLYDIEANGEQVSNKLADLFGGYTKSTVPAQGCSTRHNRQIMFVKPLGFWIVSDFVNITGPETGTHTITQQWQPQLNPNLKIDETTKNAKTSYSEGANILIVPSDPETLNVSIEEGFYSTNSKDFLMYEKELTGTGNVTFDTVLFPIREGDSTATASVSRIATGKPYDEETALLITTSSVEGEHKGYYYNSYKENGEAVLDKYKTDGKTVYFEPDSEGGAKTANIYNGSYIAAGAEKIVDLPTKVSDFSISEENGVINISSSIDDEKFFYGTKIKVQKADKIYFNGRAIKAFFNGNVAEIGKTENNAVTAEVSLSLSENEFGVIATGEKLPELTIPFTEVKPVEATAMRLFDGNLETVWTAEDNTEPQSVFFDFGNVKPLEKMEIFWDIPSDGPKIGSFDYGISVSNDGKNYMETHRLKSEDFISRVGLHTDARYVKITVYDNTVADAAGIRDVTFYEYNGNSRELSDGSLTAFSLGEEGERLSNTAKIVIPGGGDLNVALLNKGNIKKLDGLTKLETAKSNMNDNSVIAARDKSDLVIYTNVGGTFALSNGEFALSDLPVPSTGGTSYSGGGSSSGGSSSSGGGVSTSNGGSTATNNTPQKEQSTFKDISGHWAEEEILGAALKGLINGTSESTFEPDRYITRAEFAAVAVRAMGLEPQKYSGTFSDISGDEWYADIIYAAFGAGLIKGYDDGNFYPNSKISRQETAMVIAAMLKDDDKEITGVEFTDGESIAPWAVDAVLKTVSAGIFKGDEQERFNPEKPLTRAEAAAVFYRMVQGDFLK